MTDTALSKEAMLASLRDIRLPSEAAGGVVSDVAVAIGVAGMAAILVIAILRLLSQRPRLVREQTPKDALLALRGLPEADRRVGLLHLLRDHAPDRYAALRNTLYRPDGAVDVSQLEAEVARVV